MLGSESNIEDIMRARVTEKVLGTLENRSSVPPEIEAKNRPLIEDAIAASGWAPFHYPRNVDKLSEPWRAHVLWNQEVRKLSRFLSDDLQLTIKEPQLAAASRVPILVTWIPENATSSIGQCDDPIVFRNEEHLAAASAMVQNLLLALTAKGMGNYWSSGGKLRERAAFDYLSIPQLERLLAAVFVEYPEMRDSKYGETSRKPGALRDKRSNEWYRAVSL